MTNLWHPYAKEPVYWRIRVRKYIFVFIEKVSENDDMPLVFKLYWSIHNTTLILSIVITIIYWTILHTGMSYESLALHKIVKELLLASVGFTSCTPYTITLITGWKISKYYFWCFVLYWTDNIPVSPTNVMTHACNSALMFLDMLIMAYPLRLYHVVQPIILGLIYVVFSAIYYAAGGTDKYVYCICNWIIYTFFNIKKI